MGPLLSPILAKILLIRDHSLQPAMHLKVNHHPLSFLLISLLVRSVAGPTTKPWIVSIGWTMHIKEDTHQKN